MIRVVIIGAGGIAATHIDAYLKFKDRCRVVALADIYPNKAEELVKQYGLDAHIFSDHTAALHNVDFDLASICLPPFAHAGVAIDLLKAGKHVLVEKPMATSLGECDQMLEAAQVNKRLLSTVAQFRFKTPMIKVKKLIESGIIGRIVHAQVDSFWWRGGNYYDLWWRGTWEKEGGGCAINHAVHQIDLFHWMIGMPNSLQAVVANVAHDNSEVEDFATAVLFYKNGSIGQISASLFHHGEPQQLVIQGERAMISVPWKVRTSTQRDNGFPEDEPELEAKIQSLYDEIPALDHEGHEGQIANVLEAIQGKEKLAVDGRDGRNTIELVTAIYNSGFAGQRICLPLDPINPFYTRAGIAKHAPHFHEKVRTIENFQKNDIIVGALSDQ